MSQSDNASLWQENKAFFQASMIKGARYLDDAGKILNDYRDEYYDTSVGIEGLRFAQPKRNNLPDEMAVDVNRIWVACYGDGCIRKVKENAESITKAISRHIGVESYSRLGFRVYYFKSVSNVREYVQRLYNKITGPEVQAMVSSDRILEMIARTRFSDGQFSIWLGVHAVTIVRPSQKKGDYPSDGVIIDVDVSEGKDSSRRSLSARHLATFVKESSDRVVSRANETIEFLRGVEKNAVRS